MHDQHVVLRREGGRALPHVARVTHRLIHAQRHAKVSDFGKREALADGCLDVLALCLGELQALLKPIS
jgi:hypothetical protein